MAKAPAKSSAVKAKKRRSAFVPRILAPVAIVGVIPACVVAACGGNVVVDPNTTSVASSVGSANTSTGFFVAYLAYEAGAGGSVGNGGSTTVGASSSSSGFFVAAVAYPAYEGGAG